MSFKKILFIGLGGAGQRHLRIFRQLLPASTLFSAYRHTGKTPLLNANFTVDDINTIEKNYNLQMFDSLKSAFAARPDLTVVSTPTAHHREPMMLAMEAGSGVLVEKPWAENLEGFSEFQAGILAKQLPFQISFQRRFHPQIARACSAVKTGLIGRPMAATFTVYSHVPSWHSYENWRDLYAVRPEQGGGVLLTEIHEIDLVNWFFGLPEAVFCSGGNRGAERLAVEDTVQMTLLYGGFSVQVTLCFMHKKTSRGFHIAGTDGDIVWDGEENRLAVAPFAAGSQEYVQVDPDFKNDDMFMAQAMRFLSDWTLENTKNALAAAEGALAIVDAARRSLKSGNPEALAPVIMNGNRRGKQ
ncbi:MAG: Gfo/Idh/MocA family oxidoreductase [Candidatus Margulisbacteria bacterium]|jgi:predicted dehydrogenase|nr:Gfo/Idh/MocA family oxidoreductase [Candidatus Margulisiibacteriota bacterium]